MANCLIIMQKDVVIQELQQQLESSTRVDKTLKEQAKANVRLQVVAAH